MSSSTDTTYSLETPKFNKADSGDEMGLPPNHEPHVDIELGDQKSKNKPRIALKEGTESFWSGLWNSLNYSLGISLFGFPYFFKLGGWIIVPFILGSSIISLFTARFLGYMLMSNPDISSYADICKYAFPGKFGQYSAKFVRAFQVSELYAYYIYAFVLFIRLIESAAETAGTTISSSYVYLIILVSLIPTLYLTSMKMISLFSSAGVFAFFSTVILGFQDSFYGANHVFNPSKTSVWPESTLSIFQVFGTTMLLFSGHAAYPAIYFSLKNKQDYFAVVNITTFFVAVVAILLGSSTYLKYGSTMSPLIVDNIEKKWIGILTLVMAFAKVYSSCYTLPFPLVREIAQIVNSLKCGRHQEEANVETPEEKPNKEVQLSSEAKADNDNSVNGQEPLYPIIDLPIPEMIGATRLRRVYTDPGSDSSIELQTQQSEVTITKVSPKVDDGNTRDATIDICENCARLFTRFLSPENLVRIGIMLSGFFLAVIVPSIAFIMSFIGAVFAVQISVTFIGILYFRLSPNKKAAYASLSFSIIGLFVMCSALYATIASIA